MGLFSKKKKAFSGNEIPEKMLESIEKLGGLNDVLTFSVDEYIVQVLRGTKKQIGQRYQICFFLYEPENQFQQKPTSQFRDDLINYYNSNSIEWKELIDNDPKTIWTFSDSPQKVMQICKDIFEKVLKKYNYEMKID